MYIILIYNQNEKKIFNCHYSFIFLKMQKGYNKTNISHYIKFGLSKIKNKKQFVINTQYYRSKKIILFNVTCTK